MYRGAPYIVALFIIPNSLIRNVVGVYHALQMMFTILFSLTDRRQHDSSVDIRVHQNTGYKLTRTKEGHCQGAER
jgi:hypothetical protein